MSEPNEAIEVTAPSVDEAIKQALDQLGASEDDVIIHVLSTPRSGVLGLGARQARVRVERRAPQGARSGVMSRRPRRRRVRARPLSPPPQAQPVPANRGPRRHCALIASNALPNSRASVKHRANTINFASAIRRPNATGAAISRRRRGQAAPHSAATTPPRRGMRKARAEATRMEAKQGGKRSGLMSRRARQLPSWRTCSN